MDAHVRNSIEEFYYQTGQSHRVPVVKELINCMSSEGRRYTLKGLMREAATIDGEQRNATGRLGTVMSDMCEALGAYNSKFREMTKSMEMM